MLHNNFFLFFLLTLFLLIILSSMVLFFERKLIGIFQRRLGISFLGRNGWLHLPADILKFLSKYNYKNNSYWNFFYLNIFLLLLLFYVWNCLICLFFVNNSGNFNYDFLTFQIFLYFSYANMTTLYLFFLIVSLKSKYAVIGANRLVLATIFLEFFFYIIFFFYFISMGGFSFEDVVVNNYSENFILFALPICFFLLVYSLYEAKRAPFDHAEAESELVAGHIIEFGGRSLLFYFFSEYIHLFFLIFFLFIFVFGGHNSYYFFNYFFIFETEYQIIF